MTTLLAPNTHAASSPRRGRNGRVWMSSLPKIGSWGQATILVVNPPVYRGSQVYVSWTSSSPAGTWFQIYLNGVLAYVGRKLSATLPIPHGPIRIDVGVPPTGQEHTSFASLLPPAPTRRAQLTWLGGTYEGVDLAGFHVYGGDSPAATIDYSTPLATITAYPSGIYTDGFGMGGFGYGGFGESAGAYSWTSDPLAGGTWNFGVKAFDAAGNEGTASTQTISIVAPPRLPAPFVGTTSRLQYTYVGSPTYEVTLNWNASAA
jgi:hypothetical protein